MYSRLLWFLVQGNNAAGVNFASPTFLEHPEEKWDFVININLKGTFLSCQVFGEHMAENGGGAILNFGSVTSLLPLSKVFGYSASKAAVLNLSRNIAQDMALKNVRCNTICPGFFPAEQNRKILDPERVENIMRGTPMRRYGNPDELAGAALLLCSRNAAGFITGAGSLPALFTLVSQEPCSVPHRKRVVVTE